LYLLSYSQSEKINEIEKDLASIQRNNKKAKTVSYGKVQNISNTK
jgi:hypothetical protein